MRLVLIAVLLAPLTAAASTPTNTTIVSVMNEPSLPFETATVSVHISAEPTPPPSGLVEVRGSDGSYAQCIVGNGDAFCLISFDADGTVMLTAKYFGDGMFDASTSTAAAHSVTSPLTLSAPLTAQTAAVWTMNASGLTPNGSVTVDYGDLSAPAPASTNGAGQATLTHTFVLEGMYIVTVNDTAAAKTDRRTVNVFSGTIPGDPGMGLGTVFATAGSQNGDAAINVAVDEVGLMPSAPAIVATGIYPTDPTPSPPPSPSFTYDVRARNVVTGAGITVWFTYPPSVTTPELTWFNAGSMIYVPVRSSADTDPKVDPYAHTIEVRFDDTSTPRISQLTGSVLSTHQAPPPKDLAGLDDFGSSDDLGSHGDDGATMPSMPACNCGLGASATGAGAGAMLFACVLLLLLVRRRAG